MEKNNKEIFNVNNYYLNNSLNNGMNKCNNVNVNDEQESECDSEESLDENLTRFDKYVYTFLLCYANLTYVSLLYG